eukprot:GILI01019879.1.p1 GENE.GILI01019879.1~~GILI01019879.1.p1  ORF type:complete len:169 (+),score=23.85 GILI01019879.1:118-624(+)
MSLMGSVESKDSRPQQQPPQQQDNMSQPAAQRLTPSNASQAPHSITSSVSTTGGWIAETDERIFQSGLVPRGYTTAPNVPAGQLTKGCEPCVNPPKGPTGMNLFQAMRKEWRTKTVNPPPPQSIQDVDPDEIADAIEDTPGDVLEPPVHLPVMLDILIDIWEDSGLYD